MSETASTILVASVTGEGLVLAVYALITSILSKIIKARSELIEENKKEVNSLLDVYNKNKTNENFERLTKSHNRLSNLRSFPAFFSIGMFFAFLFYSLASFFAFLSLTYSYFEGFQNLFFYFATALFLGVGIYTFLEVSRAMKHEWKALDEEKEEAEKSTSEELERLREDIKKLRLRDAEESLNPKFLFLRFPEESEKPIKSSWSIRILHPDRPIERCSVTYNGVKLPWWDKPEPYYEKLIYAMSGGNLRIPKGIEKEDAEVIVRDGKKIILRKKFKDMPTVDA